MRPLFRAIAPIIAATVLAAAGASSAFASASPSSASLDASWCYAAGAKAWCYEVEGTVFYLDTTAGSTVTVHKTVHTTVYESGLAVGEIESVQLLRGVLEADGTIVTQSVINTRSTAGDEPCAYHLVLRLVDFEAIAYHQLQSCTA